MLRSMIDWLRSLDESQHRLMSSREAMGSLKLFPIFALCQIRDHFSLVIYRRFVCDAFIRVGPSCLGTAWSGDLICSRACTQLTSSNPTYLYSLSYRLILYRKREGLTRGRYDCPIRFRPR